MKMKEFLKQYFGQLRFNDMPAPVFARFQDYAKANGRKGDFAGNMKIWAKHYLVRDEDDSALVALDENENVIKKPLPNASDIDVLSDDELTKIYEVFRDTLRNMSENAKTFEDNDPATKFLGKYFPGTMFKSLQADSTAESQIQGALKTLLTGPNQNKIEAALKYEGILNDDFSFKDLVDGIDSKKYNKSLKFADQLKQVANSLTYPQYSQSQNLIEDANGGTLPDFNSIIDGFEDTVTADQLSEFREELPEMLRKLHNSEKVRTVFTNNGGTKITSHYDNAVTELDYGDSASKSYVIPKRDDELTPWQQLQDMVSDTYNDVLAKYLEFKGDKNYIQVQAKDIVKAINKVKIKPTDGLGTIIDKAEDIKSKFRPKSNPSTTSHFDWTISTLKDLRDSMPKAFDGCLRNGKQMRRIVEEICIRAAEQHANGSPVALPAAKTAMEVLSVMQYGLTTSKIMETLKGQDFKVFSDGNLSWNKNEAMKFVSAALDKSIKTAFMGIGYGITMVGNAFYMRGGNSKFNNKKTHDDGYSIADISAQWEDENQQRRNATLAANQAKDVAGRQKITDNRNAQNTAANTYQTATGTNALRGATNFDTLRTDINNRKQATQARRDNWQQRRDNDTGIQELDTRAQLERQWDAARNNRRALKQDLRDTLARKPQLGRETNDPDILAQLMNQWSASATELQQQLNDANTAMADAFRQYRAADNSHTPAEWAAIEARNNTFATELSNIEAEEVRNRDAEGAINAYEEAAKNIEEEQQLKHDRDEAMANWDDNNKNVYKDLMAHWDFLQTGRLTHTGPTYSWAPRNIKKNQKVFDAKKLDLIAAYKVDHGYSN